MLDGDTFRGERPAFAGTAEEVAKTPGPGDCIRILRRTVSLVPDDHRPYFVMWEYEVISCPSEPERPKGKRRLR